MPILNGRSERLEQLGLLRKHVDPPPSPQVQEPLLKKLGKEDVSLEEKARIIAETRLNNLTESDIAAFKLTDIDRIAKLGGLGGVKKPSAADNPVISAILDVLGRYKAQPPEMTLAQPVSGGDE